MFDPTVPDHVATRLRALLQEPACELGEEAVAEARSIGPEAAADVVASLLEAERTRPTASRAPIRAVHLAHELGLLGAVPELVRCVELLVGDHPLRRAALAALGRFGSPAVDALLASFARCRTTETRARLAEALSRTTVDDDRIRVALVRMLEDDPSSGAWYLAERGEWRSVPDLSRAVDRLAVAPVADCEVCAGEHLTSIAWAIHVLGGTLSEAQERKIDQVLERRDALWTLFEDPLASPGERRVPAARHPRPGRNDPCPCGSGKKYKRCHLEADEREARH